MAEVLIKGKPFHTQKNLPAVGSKAPDFHAVNADLEEKSLKDLKGKYKVLSFVPSLDTGVCSLSTKKFNEQLGERTDTCVCVLSCDLPFAQKRWCELEKAKHVTALSLMRSKKAAEDYGVLLVDGPLQGVCARAVFVIDEHDKILYVELVKELTHEPNYSAVLEALE